MKRYTEAELIEIEHASCADPDCPAMATIRELTGFIRSALGVEEIPPQKPPRPDGPRFWRSFERRRKVAAQKALAQKVLAVLEAQAGDIPYPFGKEPKWRLTATPYPASLH
jgi:hypothetical protein